MNAAFSSTMLQGECRRSPAPTDADAVCASLTEPASAYPSPTPLPSLVAIPAATLNTVTSNFQSCCCGGATLERSQSVRLYKKRVDGNAEFPSRSVRSYLLCVTVESGQLSNAIAYIFGGAARLSPQDGQFALSLQLYVTFCDKFDGVIGETTRITIR